jgi:ribosomal protein L3 glutamine methyltransferase
MTLGAELPATIWHAIERVSHRLEQAGVALGQGTVSWRDEAAWLVLWALGLPLDADDAALQAPVDPALWSRVVELTQQRIDSRLPMAYLSGEAWLQGVPFTVDPRAIIPRSLIAEALAEGLLDRWVPEGPARVLDLCTGNGSLAVLCAMAWPGAQIDAIDLSSDALDVAHLNVQRHGLTERIRLIQGDGLAHAQGPYDLVVCNPPYVNHDSMQALPPEFRHEPALALAGGADGMDFIRPMLAQLPRCLKPSGALVLEIGHEIEHFVQAFAGLPALWLPTSAGDEQVLLIEAAALREFAA